MIYVQPKMNRIFLSYPSIYFVGIQVVRLLYISCCTDPQLLLRDISRLVFLVGLYSSTTGVRGEPFCPFSPIFIKSVFF